MFKRLAPPLQRALWELGWKGLRETQVQALPLILDTRDAVVIALALEDAHAWCQHLHLQSVAPRSQCLLSKDAAVLSMAKRLLALDVVDYSATDFVA